jgi:hypothetical protein
VSLRSVFLAQVPDQHWQSEQARRRQVFHWPTALFYIILADGLIIWPTALFYFILADGLILADCLFFFLPYRKVEKKSGGWRGLAGAWLASARTLV